jgi:hypothetical protein
MIPGAAGSESAGLLLGGLILELLAVEAAIEAGRHLSVLGVEHTQMATDVRRLSYSESD